MFLSLGGAIIVEWICMYFFWPEAGWQHACAMLDHELSWLSKGFLQSVVVQEPGRTATWLVQTTYDWLVVKTGLQNWVQHTSDYAATGQRSRGFDIQLGLEVINFLLQAAVLLTDRLQGHIVGGNVRLFAAGEHGALKE
ncbi:hypothetical protein ALQ62_04807 [Pseudomonas coronafaciens pv. zizaniae]|nr:hypothetical protein ALQ62_04807 [Pseudomonas coronafaciens pv. zizaniae]